MRADSQKKDEGMDAANGVVVTYSRVPPAHLEPPEETPRGPLFDAVEVPHVRPARGRRRGNVDSVVPESAVAHDNDDFATSRRRSPVGRVVLIGLVAFAAGLALLALTFATAMKGTPTKLAVPATAAAPDAAASAARQAPPGNGPAGPAAASIAQPETHSLTAAPVAGQPAASSATPAATAAAPADQVQPAPPPPKARPKESAKAEPAPPPAQAAPPVAQSSQPASGNDAFTANIEKLLTRPALNGPPQSPAVVVPPAPPVAAVPGDVTVGSVEPPPLPPPADPFAPPGNIGQPAPRGLVPPADIPNVPPSGPTLPAVH